MEAYRFSAHKPKNEPTMRGRLSSEACRFCVAGLPHIPFAVGFGRSGPSQTCPQTIQSPRNTSSEPEAEGELPPSVPAVYEALTEMT